MLKEKTIDNGISVSSYKAIQKIGRALDYQVAYDKAHNIAEFNDIYFSMLEKHTNELAPAPNLIMAINNNSDLLYALNLDVVDKSNIVGEDSIFMIYHLYDNTEDPNESSICVSDLSHAVNFLIKHGRKFIAQKVSYNKQALHQIQSLRSKLNNIQMIK